MKIICLKQKYCCHYWLGIAGKDPKRFNEGVKCAICHTWHSREYADHYFEVNFSEAKYLKQASN